MPVIINDFEVVSEPPGPRAETSGAPPAPATAPEVRPEDVEWALMKYHERCLRVMAD